MIAQRKKIKDFRSVVGCTEKVAKDFLSKLNWNLEAAIDEFYQKNASDVRDNSVRSHGALSASLEALFDQFEDPEEKGICVGESLQKYLKSIEVDPNAKEALQIMYLLEAKDVGVVSRDEFCKGWASRGVSTLAGMKKVSQALPRTFAIRGKEFSSFFKYLFDLLREDDKKRTIPLDLGLGVMRIVFESPDLPLARGYAQFLEDNEDVRGFTRDLWNQSLLFLLETKPDLSNYDQDGAWPTIIDDFVTKLKAEILQ